MYVRSEHETVVKYLVDHGADIFGSKCSRMGIKVLQETIVK